MALQLTRTTRDRISFHSIPSPFPQIFYFSIPSSPCFVHLKFRSLIIWKRWNESFFFFSSSFLPSVLSTILSIDFVEKNFDIIPFSFLFPLSLSFFLLFIFIIRKSPCLVYPERGKLNTVFIYFNHIRMEMNLCRILDFSYPLVP